VGLICALRIEASPVAGFFGAVHFITTYTISLVNALGASTPNRRHGPGERCKCAAPQRFYSWL